MAPGPRSAWHPCCYHLEPMKIIKQVFDPAIPIASLKEHPDNPRLGNDWAVAESIDTNKFYGAILVHKQTKHIIGGNTRYRVAKADGADTIPGFWITCTAVEAKRILLADNRTSDIAGYDDDALLRLLSTEEMSLEGTGYSDDDVAALIAAADTSGFGPITDEDQPRLDQRESTVCPDCGYEWRIGPNGTVEPVARQISTM